MVSDDEPPGPGPQVDTRVVGRSGGTPREALSSETGAQTREALQPEAGLLITDRLRLARPLASGGMASVWIADHLTLHREVAVKFVLVNNDAQLHERLAREAQLAARIDHPHAVRTFDQGALPDGTPFLVMELPEMIDLWFGMVTTLGGVMIWRRNMTAIWVSAMVGGLADLGYLVFVDVGGFATFFPGTLMTLIAGSAIVLGGWVWLSQRKTTA